VKKTMWGNTVAIYSVLKRKKNYKTKFSTNSILKKNQQKRFWKKKTQKNEKNEDNFAEKNGKKTCGES
jgi:hypothetical protein